MANQQSAATRVFNTPELLEAILLKLRINTVWKCQQVNERWRRTIEGSIMLQRALFLKPFNDTKVAGQRDLSSKPIINPIFLLNNAGEDKQTGLKHLDFYIGPQFRSSSTPSPWRDTVRNMFFTQPHRSAARIFCKRCRTKDDKGWFGVQHDKGLRAGMVVDEMVKHIEVCHPGEECDSLLATYDWGARFHGSFFVLPNLASNDCATMDVLDETIGLKSWTKDGSVDP